MTPCSRNGLLLTWWCNWKCVHCYQKEFTPMEGQYTGDKEVPLSDAISQIEKGLAYGYDKPVVVGFSEPTLYKPLPDLIKYCSDKGLYTSIVTNGTNTEVIEHLFSLGLNQIELSIHMHDERLNEIACNPIAFRSQSKTLNLLHKLGKRFCANVAIQKSNYKFLPQIAQYLIENNVGYVSFMNYTPTADMIKDMHNSGHNQSKAKERAKDILVDPKLIRPYLETAIRFLAMQDIAYVIKQFPLCHLSPEYWQDVVNGKFLLFSPYEYNYLTFCNTVQEVWRKADRYIDRLFPGNKTVCKKCSAYTHCLGWLRESINILGEGSVNPFTSIPNYYKEVWDTRGGLLGMSPYSKLTGNLDKDLKEL